MKTVIHWIKFATVFGSLGAAVALVAVGIFVGTTTKYSKAEEIPVIVEIVVEVPRKAPVLERIMDCESGKRNADNSAIKGSRSHYDKNGQVLINNTQDIGIMQIHVPIWGKKATEMGLNLAVEADNIKFGNWLYEQYGTEPWVHSKPCWDK